MSQLQVPVLKLTFDQILTTGLRIGRRKKKRHSIAKQSDMAIQFTQNGNTGQINNTVK